MPINGQSKHTNLRPDTSNRVMSYVDKILIVVNCQTCTNCQKDFTGQSTKKSKISLLLNVKIEYYHAINRLFRSRSQFFEQVI